MIQAKIIGAGGYGGVGITELLLKHPKIDIIWKLKKKIPNKFIYLK